MNTFERQIDSLFQSLNQRRRPEDIAQLIVNIDKQRPRAERFTKLERKIIAKATRNSLQNLHGQFTSMAQDFFSPIGASKQVGTAQVLFQSEQVLDEQDCLDPTKVESFIKSTSPKINKEFSKNSFLFHRLNREQRKDKGINLSKRQYNKRFRLLVRLEKKLQTLITEHKKRKFTLVGKSGLASEIPKEEFCRNLDSAFFIAYFVARSNLRSEFTISKQQRPFDEIAEVLFARCQSNPPRSWKAIAMVYPKPKVLSLLHESQKGELIGRWFELLTEIAELLQQVWNRSNINKETMIVQVGNDSSTWNNTANAWNKARTSWIALLYAMGMDQLLDDICPGKVMRLMAGDVAAWHKSAGGGLDPNTQVWNELPLPWLVLQGKEACGRKEIEQICKKYNLDPIKKGWIAPNPHQNISVYKPTPELVHGVSVQSPQLASVLRKAKWFSGKAKVKPVESIQVLRDNHGYAIGVTKESVDK